MDDDSTARDLGHKTTSASLADRGTGKALKRALRKHRSDPDWASELRELRDEVDAADHALVHLNRP